MGLSSSKSASSESTSTSDQDHDDRTPTLWGNADLDLSGSEPGGPRFHRGLLWTLGEHWGHSPTVDSTYRSTPLPRPPAREFRAEIKRTLAGHADLFRIVTPINISTFGSLLKTHPNRPFVESVLTGLREGFWPFANTNPEGWVGIPVDPRCLVIPSTGE
jgi:hypothetical protein